MKLEKPTLDHLISTRIARELPGVGAASSQYSRGNHEQLLKQYLPPSNSEIITRLNQQAEYILNECLSLLFKIDFFSSHSSYWSDHAYRCFWIAIVELNITDPMVLATTVLHDLYHKLLTEHCQDTHEDPVHVQKQLRSIIAVELRSFFSQPIHGYTPTEFRTQLSANLEDLFVLENQLETLAVSLEKTVESKFEPESQLTPSQFFALRSEVIATHIWNSPQPGSELFSLTDLFRYCLDALNQHNSQGGLSIGERTGGFAVVVALLAEAMDHAQNADSLSQHYIDHSATKGRMLVYNLVLSVFARTTGLKNGVKTIGESVNKAFFPEQWSAFQEALASMPYFDKQYRMNMIALKSYVSKTLNSHGFFDATPISHTELEKRKVLASNSLWNGPLIGEYEYCIVGDIKTPSSVFVKWASEVAKGRLSTATQTTVEEEVLTQFSSPDRWVNYIHHTPDTLRASVLLGNSLAEAFTALQIESQLPWQFSYKDEENQTATTPNHYVPMRNHSQIRKEAEEWHALETDPLSGLLLQVHLILQLHESLQNVPLLPFEVHIESYDQWHRNTLGTKLHDLYKERDLLYSTYLGTSHSEYESQRQEEVFVLLTLHHLILKEVYAVTYNGAIEEAVSIS